MYSELSHIADMGKVAHPPPVPVYASGKAPVTGRWVTGSKERGRGGAGARLPQILTFDTDDIDGKGTKVPTRDIVVEPRPARPRSKLEPLATSTFTPSSGGPQSGRLMPNRACWQPLAVLGWWDTHAENGRETPKKKVSHFFTSALILGRSVRSVGDAIKSKC